MILNFDDARKFRGTGFRFDIPVPLPNLGHRWVRNLALGDLQALLLVEQQSRKEPIDGMTIEGPGLHDHTHDRFGRYSYSKVELRFAASVHALLHLGLFDGKELFELPDGLVAGMILASLEGRSLCVGVSNDLIDAYSIVHRCYTLPRITDSDLHLMKLLDWSRPEQPQLVGMVSGIEQGSTRFGRRVDYPGTKIEELDRVVARKRTPAEDLFLAGLRDLSVERLSSAAAHLCLSVEVFVRSLLAANKDAVLDREHEQKTLKPMCERKSLLACLIGTPLNKNSHGVHRERYMRVAALRDRVLHHGDLRYEVRLDGSVLRVEIDDRKALEEHMKMATSLVEYLNQRCKERGHHEVPFAIALHDAPGS